MSVVLRVAGRVIIWQVGSSQTILQDTHAMFENYLASSQYHHFVFITSSVPVGPVFRQGICLIGLLPSKQATITAIRPTIPELRQLSVVQQRRQSAHLISVIYTVECRVDHRQDGHLCDQTLFSSLGLPSS